MHVQPYLSFNGRCEEAVKYYQAAVGAEVQMLMRNKESPEPPPPGMLPPGSENKVLHVALRIGDTVVLASDGPCTGTSNFQGISLALTVTTAEEADRAFARLAAGGRVSMPLTKTFFSPRFGMLVDRFGLAWMIMVAA